MPAVLLQLGRLSWQRHDTSSMRSRVNEASWWMRRASRVSPTICIFTFTTSRRVCNSQGRPLGSASGPTRRITVSNWLLCLSAAVTTWRLAVLSRLVIYSCSVRSSTKFRGLFCGVLWWPCLPVCYLSVREHNSVTIRPIFTMLCMLPMSVVRSSPGGVSNTGRRKSMRSAHLRLAIKICVYYLQIFKYNRYCCSKLTMRVMIKCRFV